MSKLLPVYAKAAGELIEVKYGQLGDANLDLIPEARDCDYPVEPGEYNALVLPATMPEKLGSLIIPEGMREMEQAAMQIGRIVALSPLAFSYAHWPEGTRLPQVGDIVYFARYAGGEVPGFDGRMYRTIKDQDIIGRVPTQEERKLSRGAAFQQEKPKHPVISGLSRGELSDLRDMTGGDFSKVHIFNAGEPKEAVSLNEEKDVG